MPELLSNEQLAVLGIKNGKALDRRPVDNEKMSHKEIMQLYKQNHKNYIAALKDAGVDIRKYEKFKRDIERGKYK